ncbi:MAG: YidB family protein, partial [Pseudomonadota bacterium]
MNIVEMGASILSEKLGVDLDPNAIAPALNSLLANDSGELDLAGLAGKMASSGNLGSVISSWLGDGANDAISAESIGSLFGDKLGPFAQQLGVSSDDAASGLASALPEIMDKSSSGGSLLEMAGGASGLLSAASS